MTQNFKVLHVLGGLRSSGAEVMLKIVGSRWREVGVDAHVLSTGQVIGPYAPDLADADYGIHHVPFRKSPWFFREVYRTLRRHRFDVVHVHTERAFFWLCVIARLAGARPVRTVHNSFGFEGGLRVRRAVQRFLARAIGTRFVSVGETVQRNEQRRFRNPTRWIPNWFDADRFVPPTAAQRQRERAKFGFGSDEVVLVTVGNCSPIKNHEALLRAIASHPSAPRLLHVGEEPAGSPEQHLARDLGIEDRCLFLGRVDPLSALHAADLYAMPSLYEGLSIASLEALSTGLPALLTDVPGSRDLRTLQVDITWSGTSAEALLQGLDRAIAANPERRDDAHRVRQHEHVASTFAIESSLASYLELYRGQT